jgi:DNA-binding CsgD family transcriptional regulator
MGGFHDPIKADAAPYAKMSPSRTGQSALPLATAAMLFERIGTADFLPALFAAAAEQVPCDGGCIMQYFADRKPVYLFHKPSPRRSVEVDAYFGGPYVLDPFFRLHMVEGVGEGVYWLGEVAGDDFTDSDYYKTFYALTDAFDELDLHVTGPGGLRISVFLVRSRESGRFCHSDAAHLADFLGLVRAALLRHIAITASAERPPTPEDLWHAKLLVTFGHFAGSVLTTREREVVMYMLNGYSAGLTGERLGISEGTVRNHRKAIHKKLDIGSQAELFTLFLSCIPFADADRPVDPLIAYEAAPAWLAVPSGNPHPRT